MITAEQYLKMWCESWDEHDGPVLCVECRREVESDRRPPAYSRPTCYDCLPPPCDLEEVG